MYEGGILMTDISYAGDKLLDSWLNLTSTLWNTRLVSSLTYNEAHVMGLLLRHSTPANPMTATDLIRRTRLLKSQMNKILTALESRGYITRTRSVKDERSVEIELTARGKALESETAHIRDNVRAAIVLTEEEDKQLSQLLSKLLFGLEKK
jgi:DNA-binding MarR family transcriptional regulator